jgi:hypothetical protein
MKTPKDTGPVTNFLLALSAESFSSREPTRFDCCSGGMPRDTGDDLRPDLIKIFSKSLGLKVSNPFFQIRRGLFRNTSRMFRNLESFSQEKLLLI